MGQSVWFGGLRTVSSLCPKLYLPGSHPAVFAIFSSLSPHLSKYTKHVDFVSKPKSGIFQLDVLKLTWYLNYIKGALMRCSQHATPLGPLRALQFSTRAVASRSPTLLPPPRPRPLTGRPRCSRSISPGGSCHTRPPQQRRPCTGDRGTPSSRSLLPRGRSCPQNSR